jgi:dTDP-4-amino-4,6-dideoxygalactose transaminase
MIPFLNLNAQFNSIRDELLAAAVGALESTQYILGPRVKAFEDAFASYCGVSHAIGMNSGTSALHLALVAAGIGSGDEVITTPMTFMATTAAILYAGATPVFVDIEDESRNIDPAKIEAAITPRTKAILPVHLYGQMADMPRICEIAKKHGLIVIEDAAQSHGAEWKGKRAGSWGIMACFSFYPGKNLGACGEAGAVVTPDGALAGRLRSLRDWGQEGRYNHVLAGFNARMDAVQGATLEVKLRHLERWNERRRQVAAIYLEKLAYVPGLLLPREAKEARHIYHIYAVRVADRLGLQRRLTEKGIGTGIHYPQAVHQLVCYKDKPFAKGSWPNAEQCAAETLSLPICPMMTDEQVFEVCECVRESI